MKKEKRKLARKILRNSIAELRQARVCLGNGGAERIHKARVAIKRVRSYLRLVKKWLGKKEHRRLNGTLRKAARELSQGRDRMVVIKTIKTLAPGTRVEFKGNGAGPRHKAMDRACGCLREVCRELTRTKLAPVKGSRLEKGFKRTREKARVAYRWAARTGRQTALHEARKRAKDVQYQLRLLDELKLDGGSERRKWKEYTELLGKQRDLYLAKQNLSRRHGGAKVTGDREVLLDRVKDFRRAVVAQALQAGARVFRRQRKS